MSAEATVRFHVIALVVWLALAIPTVTIWKDSIIYVVAMSWYAIVVSHLAALAASRAEKRVDDVEDG